MQLQEDGEIILAEGSDGICPALMNSGNRLQTVMNSPSRPSMAKSMLL